MKALKEKNYMYVYKILTVIIFITHIAKKKFSNQFISFKLVRVAQGWRHRSTTTESAFAGMNPSKKTFLQPQL